MKICFFSPASYPFFSESKEHTSGGAEFQLFLLGKYLSKNIEFDVTFLVGDYGQEEVVKIEDITLFKAFNLKATDSIFSKVRYTFKYRSLLRKIRPDVVITTTANSITGITSYFKHRLDFKHIHRTAHQDDVDLKWIKKNRITGKIYRYGLEKADKVISQCKEHRQLLKQNHGINADIIRNVFIIKDFISPKKKGVLWVGRFEHWKNPGLYLELVRDNPSVMFTMICPYAKHRKKQWNLLKDEASNLKNLRFIEKVAFHEIQKYFETVQLFVNTSKKEGFPNTFLQAAQAKIPILSLNVDPDEFINKFNCGIHCNNDLKLLKSEFKRIIDDSSELRTMGNNNYEYLMKFHDIKMIINDLESIILTLQNES